MHGVESLRVNYRKFLTRNYLFKQYTVFNDIRLLSLLPTFLLFCPPPPVTPYY